MFLAKLAGSLKTLLLSLLGGLEALEEIDDDEDVFRNLEDFAEYVDAERDEDDDNDDDDVSISSSMLFELVFVIFDSLLSRIKCRK